MSWDLTRGTSGRRGLWDGHPATGTRRGRSTGPCRRAPTGASSASCAGNIDWFYGAPQESLATQGNQFWNSTEGRIEVAIDRWKRGYRSNLTEVLFFLDIWSLGLEKVKFYEIDNACNQVISLRRLGRNRRGYIDRIDLGDRYYEFDVDDDGVVTGLLHTPERSR